MLDLTLQSMHIPPDEKKIIQALLEGMIIKYLIKQMVGGLIS